MGTLLQALASIVTPTPERAQGVDLSHHDGSFDPAKATQPIDFAIMKLTEGSGWVDPKVDAIWQGVKQIPVRGGYHYLRSGYSWIQQANNFLQVAARYDLQVYALDVEEYGNKYDDTFFSDARRIIDEWRARRPEKRIVIYSNTNTYNQIFYAYQRLYPRDGAAFLEGLDFWFAWPSSIFNEPFMPKTRQGSWTFWQWSWTGKAAEWGTGAATDVNYFNGDRAALMAWAGITESPDPEPEPEPEEPEIEVPVQTEPEPEPTPFQAEALVDRIIVRTFPQVDLATATKHRISYREIVKGRIWAGPDYLWVKIDESARPELIGKWIAARKHDGTQRLLLLTHVKPGPIGQILLPSSMTFVRVLHECELPASLRTVPPGMPQIRPFFPNHHAPFTRSHQLLSRDMNPLLTVNQWTEVYHFERWVTNNQGFGMAKDPRANFVAGKDLNRPLPKVEALTAGGNLLRVIGERKEKTNRGKEDCWVVETLPYGQVAPPLSWIEARPWLITHATRLRKDGRPGKFPQGQQPDGFLPGIRHPLIADSARYPVCIPKWRCIHWTEVTPPDPYEVYL